MRAVLGHLVPVLMKSQITPYYPFKKAYSGPLPSITIPSPNSSPIVIPPKDVWRYLGIFFDRYLTFKHHVNYYTIKATSSTNALPLLGNSTRGILSIHKRLLYISC